MSLADYTPERVEIEHNGKPLVSIRGLSLDDVSILIRAHMHTLNRLFTAAQSGDMGTFGGDAFFIQLVQTAPDVAYDIIALAADEATLVNAARRLPLGIQIKILQEVTRLTLEDIGGPLALAALLRGAKLLPAQAAQIGATIQ